MTPRSQALNVISMRTNGTSTNNKTLSASDIFGSHVFNRQAMAKMLPKEVYKNVINAMENREKIQQEFSDTIAMAMKQWAVSLGATHYSHWFQPLTGASAEKHDAFIDWVTPDQVIEKFNGKQLVQGEPDASSFPSGGLRSTYEARGYTAWDPTSPVFLWSSGDGLTLCIPSVFFSWTGEVLDLKIPLLRSDQKIHDEVMRLLKLTGISANHVTSTLGCEQEYFVIDRLWRNLRPDLVMAGRTVFGAAAAKGQELQDHYFGAVKDRILSFMCDFEQAAFRLGIPVKTRHNEVAPAQHEVAPVFEPASLSVDHNVLLMELMRQMASKHGLACLLHEKPFHGVNGSGKHCNWSLATDTGINLLDPTDTPENNLHFLIILTAILHAVYRHAGLLRASISSLSNDFRLGGHEAPPAIITVYLGQELDDLLKEIEETGGYVRRIGRSGYDLGIPISPSLKCDNTDRNRTSPMAFTGSKFEFRAVGSSANPSFPVTVLNAIVAESVGMMLDEIEQELNGAGGGKKALIDAALPVVRKYLKVSRPVRFGGDNYHIDWIKEAKKRNLPIIEKSIDAFAEMKKMSTVQAFKGILTERELVSRYEVAEETYAHQVSIEINVMLDLFYAQILPAVLESQKRLSKSIYCCAEVLGKAASNKHQKKQLKLLNETIEKALAAAESLAEVFQKVKQTPLSNGLGKKLCDEVLPHAERLRSHVDFLETIVDDALWPLPKYRELFFII